MSRVSASKLSMNYSTEKENRNEHINCTEHQNVQKHTKEFSIYHKKKIRNLKRTFLK
jgi:hypothetical protein